MSRRIAWLVLFIPLLLAWSYRAAAQEATWRGAARVDAVVAERMAASGAVGCAVGVIEDGRLVYLKGFGQADRENGVPVDSRTLFRWASVSKPITAVVAMQLVERGQLDLDRDIRDYVSEFPDKEATITTRQLLCHQGGIVHYTNGKVVRTERQYAMPHPFADVVLALDRFKESPLVNAPGASFSYTTHGYILLSAVVERAGHQRFAEQVAERVCRPLRLKTLQPDYQWEELPHRAVGYRKVNDAVVRSTDTDVSWKLGGGGFISSIEDMAGFAIGVVRHELVRPVTAEMMWTRQKTSDGKETRYGLGFSIGRDADGLVVSHSGAQEKSRTNMVLWPEKSRGIVFMSNSEFVDSGAITKAIREAAWPMEKDKPAPNRPR
ncbi:MAG TPA: serine hydrolase domain-containing protein [Gemmatales bacterium]|nr:serine hydrolase domain-containing protein [Gemmatales bacterium]HMP57936.1 serine hydrolase domain-containing protein [Gemmatales bacterium]